MTSLDALLAAAEIRPPATDLEVAQVEFDLGHPIPNDYRALLRRSNGLEADLGGSYLILWRTNEIARLNEGYSVTKFLPGITLIGTDGGNEGFGFGWHDQQARYYRVPLVGMEPDELELLGSTIEEFFEQLRTMA